MRYGEVQLVLDLREVRFIDKAGIALPQGLVGRNSLRGTSSFVRALLEGGGLHVESPTS